MNITFWGTRGSIPVPGPDTLKYGGNTPCIELETGNNEVVILDAGTGLKKLGTKLARQKVKEYHIFLSHYHWDHIQGIPFFAPLYNPSCKVIFYGLSQDNNTLFNILNNQMDPLNFPLRITEVNAKVEFVSLKPYQTLKIKDLSVQTLEVTHSSPTLAYKISIGEKTLVYMTDNEIDSYFCNSDELLDNQIKFNDHNREIIDFCKDADYLIHDTMYDEISLSDKKGWGHSGHISLTLFGALANVKNLVLFHYNPEYNDGQIETMLNEVRELIDLRKFNLNCLAAQEHNTINF